MLASILSIIYKKVKGLATVLFSPFLNFFSSLFFRSTHYPFSTYFSVFPFASQLFFFHPMPLLESSIVPFSHLPLTSSHFNFPSPWPPTSSSLFLSLRSYSPSFFLPQWRGGGRSRRWQIHWSTDGANRHTRSGCHRHQRRRWRCHAGSVRTIFLHYSFSLPLPLFLSPLSNPQRELFFF